VDILQTLSAEEFDQLADGARCVFFAAGEALCREGEPGETFYVIRAGRVAVSVAGAGGGSVTVAHLGPAAFFGEMSLLTGEPRSATITAECDVEVMEVSKALFAGILKADAALAEKLGIILEKRLTDRQAKLSAGAGATAGVPARIALINRIRKFFGLG
jgi:CRP-like cAMP-binding protein